MKARQLLNRKADDDWNVCKEFFEDRQTERVFKIEDTTTEDWKSLFELVKQHPEWTKGSVGSMGPFGDLDPSIFVPDGSMKGAYFIHLDHGVTVYVFPASASWIELDVEAHQVQEPKALAVLLDFVRVLGDALRRNIQIKDSSPKAGMIEYVVETKQFFCDPPTW